LRHGEMAAQDGKERKGKLQRGDAEGV
jgi:hypothetical protein